MLTIGWKEGMVLMMWFLVSHWLQRMPKLRSSYSWVSQITEELALMDVTMKRVPIGKKWCKHSLRTNRKYFMMMTFEPFQAVYKVQWKRDDYKEKQGMYSYCMLTLLTLVIILLPSFFLLSYITVQANYTTNSNVLQVKYQLAINYCIWKYQPLCNNKGKGHTMICMCRYWGVVEVQIEPLHNTGARRRWVVSNTPWLL